MGQTNNNYDLNPFPGLRPFGPEDTDLFFCRDSERDDVIKKLLKNRYITVIGASGCGKSSLVYGGVLPGIVDSENGDSSEWKIISFRPGNDPFSNMADAVAGVFPERKDEISENVLNLSGFRQNSDSLSQIIRKYTISDKDKIILIIDQFEEIFRYQTSNTPETYADKTKRFVDLLINSVTSPDEHLLIIITMSSEYLAECSQYKGLAMLVNNSNYLVPAMGSDGFRQVIEGPVKRKDGKIEPQLVEMLLVDLIIHKNQPGILQHALRRIWDHWKELDQPDKLIDRADYELVGKMEHGISLHAEEIYEKLSIRERETCELLFKVITRKRTGNKGLRNPADIATILSVTGCSSEELFAVISKFRQHGVYFLMPPSEVGLNDNTIIDLRYEFIGLLWDRLKVWTDEEAASAGIYLRLSESSALYQQGKGGLCKPTDLQTALKWRDENKPVLAWAVQYDPAFERAMVYLRTSENAFKEEEQNKISLQKRKTRRARYLIRILGLAVLIAMGFGIFSYVQKLTSEKRGIIAEKQRDTAVMAKSMADSSVFILLKQKFISDSAASVASQEAENERKQRIVAEVQKSLAEKNATLAFHQKNTMLKKVDSVESAIVDAEKKIKTVIEQKNETQRLRMLSIGKSMSLKSLQMAGQKDLQTLLAYQAYLFNKNNNGPDNDADIYAGLYNATVQYGNLSYRSLKGQVGEIKSIAFVPGKNEFFTSASDGKVLKWSLGKNDQTLQIVYSGNDIIDVLAVSPDESWLACGSSNSSIKMIPLKGNDRGYEMNGHKGGIKSLIFSYDGKYLYSAALDGKVLKWDIAARTSINVATGMMEITSIDIASDGRYLAGISTDGNVVVWNSGQTGNNFRIETAGKKINVVRFNPENNILAIGDDNGTVELWDIALRRKISEVKAHDGTVNDIRFNTLLKQMATAGNDRKLKIYNIKNPADLNQPPVTLTDNEGIVLVMQFTPDGQMIISGESGGGDNLIIRPAHVDYMVRNICNLVSRNMTREEWDNYVGKDIPKEKTCKDSVINIGVEPAKAVSK